MPRPAYRHPIVLVRRVPAAVGLQHVQLLALQQKPPAPLGALVLREADAQPQEERKDLRNN